MGAITALLFHNLHAGDHAIVSDVAYAALSEMTNEMIPDLGISITKVDTSDIDAVQQAVRPNTKLVYIETPCNPLLRLTDIKQVSEIAHDAGAKLAVDSTFATPLATHPNDLGADLTVHSLTKYLGGHGDALGGAVSRSEERSYAPKKKDRDTSWRFIEPFQCMADNARDGHFPDPDEST